MSAIFKTGTFGFSTVFSTPCDISLEGTLYSLYLIDNLNPCCYRYYNEKKV